MSEDGSAVLVTPDDYFGGCPECGKNDGYLNVHKDQWMVCHTHKTCWYLGSKVLSTYQFETEEVWLENRQRLANYRIVEGELSPFWVSLAPNQRAKEERAAALN